LLHSKFNFITFQDKPHLMCVKI